MNTQRLSLSSAKSLGVPSYSEAGDGKVKIGQKYRESLISAVEVKKMCFHR